MAVHKRSRPLGQAYKALHDLAPLGDRGKPKRKSRPWYNSQLLEQRKVVRNRERAFIKYREDHHWRAFTGEKNRYNRMLEFNKKTLHHHKSH